VKADGDEINITATRAAFKRREMNIVFPIKLTTTNITKNHLESKFFTLE
jgi:hypothetical protein